jgi:hypothetical protein
MTQPPFPREERSRIMQESLEQQLGREAEAQRKVAQVQAAPLFMAGVREGFASWMRGEKPIAWKDLKRKYDGA